MVSRNLSERQLHVEILRNMHHAAVRGKAIGAAFELFPQAKGAIFRAFYDDKVGRRPPSSIDQLKKRLDAFIADDASPKSTMANVDPSVAEELVELYDNADFLPTCLTVLREQRGVSWTLLSNGTFDGTLSEIERTALRVLGTLRLLKMRGALLLPREEPLSFDALSSGQWQVLSSILLVAFAVRDDALVLVDEPENSLHPAWQQKYLPTLVNAMAHVRGAHVVVATHSPLVAASIHPDIGSVCAVKRTLTGRVHAELLSRTTFGWSADDILQEVFGLASSRSINFRQDLDGALKLIGQGEIHSKKLDRILTRLNIATAGLPEMDTVREVVATMNALAAERE